jgi:hypothetical protein
VDAAGGPGGRRLREGDVIADGTRTWTVVTALLRKVPGHSVADYITVTATLNPPEAP